LYWSIDSFETPYGELLRWWSSVVEDTKVELYVGHANYKHIERGDREPAWMNPEEIVNQLRLNQMFPQVSGSIFFSYSDMLLSKETGLQHKVKNESIKRIKAEYKTFIPLVSPKPHLMPDPPAAPLDVRQGKNTITWNDTEENNTRYYVVYRTLASSGITDPREIIKDPQNIIARVWGDGLSHSFKDSVRRPQLYIYVVTALNAAHVESVPVIAAKN
jgi:hypothetical protein